MRLGASEQLGHLNGLPYGYAHAHALRLAPTAEADGVEHRR